MKDEVINRLVAVLNALDNISVRGKPNLANLSGSIAILEETRDILLGCEITKEEEQPKDKLAEVQLWLFGVTILFLMVSLARNTG